LVIPQPPQVTNAIEAANITPHKPTVHHAILSPALQHRMVTLAQHKSNQSHCLHIYHNESKTNAIVHILNKV
jgi:hypothetical protein